MNFLRAVAKTAALLNFHGEPERKQQAECSPPHLAWMLVTAEELHVEGREDKANRWLGFVQGAMAATGRASVEQLKRCTFLAASQREHARHSDQV